MRTRYDVIVVGCGIAAGSFICRLALRADLRVLIVDRGVLHDPKGFHNASEYSALPRTHHSMLFSSDIGEPRTVQRWWARDSSGGGSLVWYGQLSRFEPSDLALHTRAQELERLDIAELVRDWPINLSTLTTYYKFVEQFLKPIGYRHAAKESASDCGVVIERPDLSTLETRLLDELKASGMHPYVGATCMGGRAWELAPLDPLTYRRFSGSGLANRANWYSSTFQFVRGGLIDFMELRDVRRVIFDNGRVAGIEVQRIGGDASVLEVLEAAVVVLAAGPVETVAILSRSGLDDSEGRLGQGFTYTTEAVCYVTTKLPRSPFDRDRAIGSFSSIILRDFYDGDGQHCIKGGKISIYDALACEAESRLLRSAQIGGAARSAALAAAKEHYLLKLSFKGESIPWEKKFVQLSREGTQEMPWVRYELHPHDHEVRKYAQSAFKTIAKAIPGGEIVSDALPQGTDLISGHQHGGVCFGESRTTSLLDLNCHSWTVNGLYAIDASFMPTSGATNSSHTVSANAFRVADFLRATLAE